MYLSEDLCGFYSGGWMQSDKEERSYLGKKTSKPSSLNNQLYSEKSLIFVFFFPFLFEFCQPQSLIFLQSFPYYYLPFLLGVCHWTSLWLEFKCPM